MQTEKETLLINQIAIVQTKIQEMQVELRKLIPNLNLFWSMQDDRML